MKKQWPPGFVANQEMNSARCIAGNTQELKSGTRLPNDRVILGQTS